ncbi:hypothetical protein [Chryseolinea lacunae]|uniref:CHAD domain-containing protein n=1 Tax=Chryseolinea lacunae TaxID=2801331 RepID=A0ABS1KNX8_9BACT|nr:hypothetical protein [Chryseolinea lacunae]MBL0739956.1 hypothetical protein [Chryseolinea lacunae]
MNASSSMSFAARLQKAIDVLTLLLGFSGFNPPAGFALDKFKELLDKVTIVNNEALAKEQAYRKAVAVRAAMFRTDSESVLMKVTRISNAVVAAYGRNSHPHNMMRDLARRLRVIRVVSKPADPASTTNTEEKRVTISDSGYGAMLGQYRNIVEAIKTFPDWETNMPDFKFADLDKAVADAQKANNDVMDAYGARSAVFKQRHDLYVQQRIFVQRLKGYVKSRYGSSREFDLVKSVRL